MRINTYYLVLAAFVFTVAGCGSSGYDAFKGQLLGTLDRPGWNPVTPYGMVYVPSGTLHIGPNDQDINHALVQRSKAVSIIGFYMDDTEITNNEYRQFTDWVRDSVLHANFGHYVTDEITGEEYIDWTQEIDYADQTVKEEIYALGDVYYFTYKWFDVKQAAQKINMNKPKDLFWRERTVNIYPDTFVWVRDFTYSYNEPMTRHYYSHPAYDDYPVVGIDWHQAVAFSRWRTNFWGVYRKSIGEPLMDEFRLPTEHEWEYAARGNMKLAHYPWGGPYTRNQKGCLMANFKPGRGDYPEDGGFYTVRADAYFPNDYGLYNMAGNVAEWTSSAYYENSYSFLHDLNPDIRYDEKNTRFGYDEDSPITMKRKVLRGGSWKDVAYYIQCGTRHWEYSDTSKSYIGFRNLTTYLGRDMKDR